MGKTPDTCGDEISKRDQKKSTCFEAAKLEMLFEHPATGICIMYIYIQYVKT